MAWNLSLEDYGTLMVLLNIITTFGIFTDSIQTVITKYTSNEKSSSKIKNILKRSLRKAISFSVIVFLGYIIVSIFLSSFLRIPFILLVIAGLPIFTAFINPVLRGSLAGKALFWPLGKSMIIEGLCKVILSFALVLIGFKIYGALAGIIVGAVVSFIFCLIDLKPIFKVKEISAKTPEIYNYTRPVFIVALATVLFLSLDLIIAKHFFSPTDAGIYAIASTIAKILFIGTQPISKALFPLSSNSTARHSKKLFITSIIALVSIIVVFIGVVYLASPLIIKIYTGKSFPLASEILLPLCFSMGIFAITNLIILSKISRVITKGAILLIIPIIVQIALLSSFSSDLYEYSLASLGASVIFLLSSFLLRK
jgi:O-antigen/teichoic acid export membrane protein